MESGSNDIKTVKGLQPIELAPYLLKFNSQLKSVGFTTLTIKTYSDSVCHFGTWLDHNSLSLCDVTMGTLELFSRHSCACSGWQRSTFLSKKYLRRVRRFVEYLVEINIVTDHEQPSTKHVPRWNQDGYIDWLANDRGLAPITITNYVCALTQILPDLGFDPSQYNAQKIRGVVCQYADNNGPINGKRLTTALRSYLKYLVSNGLCSFALIAAVPTIAHWRLSELPRYISVEDVQRVVQSCDTRQPIGLRDHAILLLLAQLGLRASDIANMLITDIDWNSATILVRGKSRKVSRLPLPQDVGDAILRYLEDGRAGDTGCTHLFLCVMAPHRPLSAPSIVSGIVSAAIVRSGINTPPYSGAHLLRHSAATGWLRDGISLDTVSTILRHNSADMTMHYAKVDIEALRELAVSWPGEAS